MSKISGANLFKEPANWPLIPPWWLLSSPQAAALLNVTPATLHNWRTRGEGPKAVPPMYLKATQGDPIYYQYGVVRFWAAARLGLSYSIDHQCQDFFEAVLPILGQGNGSNEGRAKIFDQTFETARSCARAGEHPPYLRLNQVEEMDLYFSRQPRALKPIKFRWS